MKFVIVRDDDVNALTPPDLLERLYRPFLARGMPVQCAVIPEVRTDARSAEGTLEGFLLGEVSGRAGTRAIGTHVGLVDYLRAEPLYSVAQHGLHHELVDGAPEFAGDDAADLVRRIERGRELLEDAGFQGIDTFVAPQDQIGRVGLREVTRRFEVLSTGYYDIRRMMRRHLATFLLQKKLRREPHFVTDQNVFLTHPGCILSYHRAPETMVPAIFDVIDRQRLTVVVSHHWEYVAGGVDRQPMVDALHSLAEQLAARRDVRVIGFAMARAALLGELG